MNWIISRVHPKLLLLILVLSPFILLYAVNQTEIAFDPDGHERREKNAKIFNEILYGDELQQELDRRCEVYVGNKKAWSSCYDRVVQQMYDRKRVR